MDRGAWWATVHRIAKSQTRMKWLSTHTPIHVHPKLPDLSLSPAFLSWCSLVHSLSLWVCFCFVNKFICIFFLIWDSAYKWCHMIFVFLWFTHLKISTESRWVGSWLQNEWGPSSLEGMLACPPHHHKCHRSGKCSAAGVSSKLYLTRSWGGRMRLSELLHST